MASSPEMGPAAFLAGLLVSSPHRFRVVPVLVLVDVLPVGRPDPVVNPRDA
ncbi:hypothetical protein AB0L06_11710 [Spirillospora sp. NPDC052269]